MTHRQALDREQEQAWLLALEIAEVPVHVAKVLLPGPHGMRPHALCDMAKGLPPDPSKFCMYKDEDDEDVMQHVTCTDCSTQWNSETTA